MSKEKIKDICRECKKCNFNPKDYWEKFPENCKLHDRIFLKREQDMENVRKAKEELLNLKIENLKGNNKNFAKINALEKYIEQFKIYGADNW